MSENVMVRRIAALVALQPDLDDNYRNVVKATYPWPKYGYAMPLQIANHYDKYKHHRRSIRLKGRDYTQAGAYFVTICAQNRKCLFGDIVDGKMRLNDAGRMVHRTRNDLSVKYPGIEIDEFVVMPNHVHEIIVIVWAPLVGAHSSGTAIGNAETRAGTRPAPTLGDVVGAFKSITTHQYADGVRQKNWPSFNAKLWQRNYYEHIIRSEEEMNRIREYIIDNPAKWDDDEDNPGNTIRRGLINQTPTTIPCPRSL